MKESQPLSDGSARLRERLEWLVRIRWIALVLAFGLVVLFAYLHYLRSLTALGITLAALAALNLLFHLLARRAGKEEGIKAQAALQVVCDLAGILALVYFTGGLTNPFLFFLVVPVWTSALFLQPRWTFLAAAAGVGLSALMGLLEVGAWIPRHPMAPLGYPDDLSAVHARLSVTIVTMGALLFTTAYLGTRTARALRKGEQSLRRHDLREVQARSLEMEAADRRRAALAGLAAGIRREVLDPLGIVRARVDAVRYDLEDAGQGEGPWLADLTVMEERVDQAARVVERVAAVLGAGTGERSPLDLCALLEASIRKHTAGEGEERVVFRRTSGAEAIRVEGDREALSVLFDGLVENALDASAEEGGRVLLSARPLPGRFPRIAVRVLDRGPVLPPEARRRLFDPFFTEGGRRGTWYAMAYLVVRSHEGALRVQPGPRGGTAVLAVFPATAGFEGARGH